MSVAGVEPQGELSSKILKSVRLSPTSPSSLHTDGVRVEREFSIIYKFIQSICKWTSLFINGLNYSQIYSLFANGWSIHKWTEMAAQLYKNPLVE